MVQTDDPVDWRRLVDNSNEGIFRFDREGVIRYANKSAAALLGYAEGELVGLGLRDIHIPEELEQAKQKFAERMNGIGGISEYRLRRKDGGTRWVSASSIPVRDAAGACLGLIGFVRDIDEAKCSEALRAHELRLLRRIAGDMPLGEVLDDLCRTLEALASRRLRCAVMIADLEQDTLSCLAAPSMHRAFRERAAYAIRDGSSACAQALRAGRPVIIADALDDGAAAPVLALRREFGYAAVWSHPIVQDGVSLGTLAFLPEAPGLPEARDAHLIEFGIEVARLALAHARHARDLRASEQRFREFVELAADWHWEQDAEFRFTAISGGILNKGNFRIADALGRTRWELDPEGLNDDLWPSHRAALARHEPFHDFVYLIRAADETLRRYCINGRPVFGPDGRLLGYRGTARDITAQVRAEEALAQAEEDSRRLFENNPLPMWIFDPETLYFLEVNSAACRHYGYSREEFLGLRTTDIRPPEEVERLLEFHRLHDDPAISDVGIWRHLKKDGTEFLAHITRGMVSYRGRKARVAVVRDVTEQLRAERQVQELNTTLEERVRSRTAELENANRELDAFNYSVSHDLRAPLRSVHGFSQALLEDYTARLDETGRDHLERICAAARRMSGLIDAMYHLSRLSHSLLQIRPLDLSEQAEAAAAELRQADPARQVEIVIAPGLRAEGDPALLRVLLGNLLGNAWKYTARAPQARIEFLQEADAEGRAVFVVRDNGVGFDMQFADKLFRLFQRLHRDEDFAGQGVGLVTAQRIVGRHGGRIWGRGEKGRGAEFRFTLWDDPALRREAEADLLQHLA